MGKIFTTNSYKTETWTAAGAVLHWGKGSSEPSGNVSLVINGITINYQRRVTPFFPLAQDASSRKRINLLSAPVGTLVIQGMIGPNSDIVNDFVEAASKECKTEADAITVTLAPFGLGCKEGSSAQTAGKKWTLRGVELASIGLSIRAAEVATIETPLQFEFTELEIA